MHGIIAVLALTLSSAAFAQPATDKPAATQPTAEKNKLYDVNADATQQIAAAVAKAKGDNRRVLIQWGGNWCSWCIKLNDLMTRDSALKKELNYEYVVVHVDAGQPKDKNLDLATSYGADLKANGFPFLTILDGNGKPVANQETSSLEKKDDKGESVLGKDMGHDPAKVLAFLKKHEAKPLDAQRVVDAGIAEAKSSGKLVFLHFGAPWCPYCIMLDNWMDRADVSPLLAKRFVNVKVDEDRMPGGKSLQTKYRTGKGGGIPWFAFIDGDGKVIATSDDPKKGNVGFPTSPEETAHFAAMLEKAGVSSEDRAAILSKLKSDKPASH